MYRSKRLPFEPLETRIVFSSNPLAPCAPHSDNAPSGEVISLSEDWSNTSTTSDLNRIRDRYQLLGHGQTVAVIDSGIAYDHPALGGGLGTGRRVVGGWDFAENDADPYDDAPLGFHGTHVAGILGSSDELHPGVATDVDFVSLRVFDDDGNSEPQWVADALWWVHEHRLDFESPITTVNLSFALGDLDDDTRTSIDSALQSLSYDGVFVTASAGNSFDGSTDLAYPASSEHVFPIGSVGADGLFSPFSQRNSRILAAPGELVTSTVPDFLYGFDGVTDDFAAASGTSMASPYVAGAGIVLREAYAQLGLPTPSPTTLGEHLRSTSDTIGDAVTSASYRRINLDSAIASAVGPDEAGITASSAQDLGRFDGSRTVTGVINHVQDADHFTFVATESGVVGLTTSWTADSAAPTVTIRDAVQSGPHQFQIQAGRTYTLAVEDALTIGQYTMTLQTVATGRPHVFAAPSSNANESHHQWEANADGMYQLDLEFVQTSGTGHVHVHNDSGQLVYASSRLFGDHRTQIYLEAGEKVRIQIAGPHPRASLTVSRVQQALTQDDAPGRHWGQSERLAAYVFSEPDDVHQLAWAPRKSVSIMEQEAVEAVDDVWLPSEDQTWLPALAADPLRSGLASQGNATHWGSREAHDSADQAHAADQTHWLFLLPFDAADGQANTMADGTT